MVVIEAGGAGAFALLGAPAVPGGAVLDDLDRLADGVERVPSRLGLAAVGGEVGRQAGDLVRQGVEVAEDLLDAY